MFIQTTRRDIGLRHIPSSKCGSAVDGIVMNWAYVGGRNLPGAGVYNLGRTLVHGGPLPMAHLSANGGQCANTFNQAITLSTPGHTMNLITVPVAPLSVAV